MSAKTITFYSIGPAPAERSIGMIKTAFYGVVWITISLALFLVFSSLGMVGSPDSLADESEDAPEALVLYPPRPVEPVLYAQTQTIPLAVEDPVITIRAVGIVSPIVFPTRTDYQSLRTALNKGVAHYPHSAFPGENGNVFLFGHSSGRASEANPARTVFTKLNRLKPGDDIEIQYGGMMYVYRTSLVRIAPPEDMVVYFQTPRKMLTLSTCWPIGDPKNRFMVEAEFVRSYPLR